MMIYFKVLTLKKAFDAFDSDKRGAITIETTGTREMKRDTERQRERKKRFQGSWNYDCL